MIYEERRNPQKFSEGTVRAVDCCSNTPPRPMRDKPQIECRMDELGSALSHAMSVADTLRSRLSPVLKPEQCAEGNGCGPIGVPVAAPLAVDIQALTARAVTVIEILTDLEARLEL